jgi:hypothetical protein
MRLAEFRERTAQLRRQGPEAVAAELAVASLARLL